MRFYGRHNERSKATGYSVHVIDEDSVVKLIAYESTVSQDTLFLSVLSNDTKSLHTYDRKFMFHACERSALLRITVQF